MKQRYLLLSIIAIGYLIGYFTLDRWPTTLHLGDSNGYYMHVVSFFINQDVGNYDRTITELREISPATGDPREDKFGIRLTEKGRYYIKYTLGVPVMETPFFLLAHAYTKLTGSYPANGWSTPYTLLVNFSIIFYIVLGFSFLISVLEQYFPKKITAFTVLAIAFATNLFYQGTYVVMSHGFLFFDYCLLIYLSFHFYKKPNLLKALSIGAVVGLIGITRVPEVISAFIPFLWGVTSWKSLTDRLLFFTKNYHYFLGAAIGFFAVFSIQFAYWYYISGYLVFNPYQGEGFNFLEPHFWNALFHFRNGWLIYTPIMIFSIIGLFSVRKYSAGVLIPLLVFVGLNMWIHYSYYVWSYFPGLGQRPMVETYPILAFALAACFATLLKIRWLSWLPVAALIIFGALNLFQTWQMNEGIIWTERGNAAFYYETFGALKPTKASLIAYDIQETQPDINSLTHIKTLTTQGFEDSTSIDFTSRRKNSGNYCFITGRQKFVILQDYISVEGIDENDWIKVQVNAYIDSTHQVDQRDICMLFGIQFLDENGEVRKEKTLKPSTHVGNEDHSIWITGKPGLWDEVYFFMRAPKGIESNWFGRVFIVNTHSQKLHVDDIRVEHFKRK